MLTTDSTQIFYTSDFTILLMYFFLAKLTCFLRRYFEALTRFQHVLTVSGINKALKEQGVAEGDTVIIGEVILVFLLKVLCNVAFVIVFS